MEKEEIEKIELEKPDDLIYTIRISLKDLFNKVEELIVNRNIEKDGIKTVKKILYLIQIVKKKGNNKEVLKVI